MTKKSMARSAQVAMLVAGLGAGSLVSTQAMAESSSSVGSSPLTPVFEPAPPQSGGGGWWYTPRCDNRRYC